MFKVTHKINGKKHTNTFETLKSAFLFAVGRKQAGAVVDKIMEAK